MGGRWSVSNAIRNVIRGDSIMLRRASTLAVLLAAATLLFDAPSLLARADVKIDFDKAFNFKAVRTWGWNPAGNGDVKMARSQGDDPARMKSRAEPLIVETFTAEMTGRGVPRADAAPDLIVTYYLLLTNSISAQTMGQFLPGQTAWGLPPFLQSTQSMEIMNRGALVLDFSANGTVVWRGVAQAQIKMDADDKKREAILREAVRDLVKRYPPKQ
jgi:hypothetical protein